MQVVVSLALKKRSMMFGITDIWQYVGAVIAIILLPGPNSIYIFSLAAQYGRRAAYWGILGVFVGDTILMALAATGISALLKANPQLFEWIKWIGASYLAWIGCKLLYSTRRKWLEHKAKAGSVLPEQLSECLQPSIDVNRPFVRGLVIDLLNPEAIIFFISFFVQFVDPSYPHQAVSFTLLGIILQIVSVSYLSLLVFAGAWLASVVHRRRWLTTSAESGAGALFIGFGVSLAAKGTAI